DVRRRCVVAPGARMENAREAPRRVVADDRARMDAVPTQRVGVQLRVLDHHPPEGPGVRDDDAHLHPAEDMDAALEDALRLAAENEAVPGPVPTGETRSSRCAADLEPVPGPSVAQRREV